MAAVTRELARYAVESRFEDLPEAVRHEGERAFVNTLGCMLGGGKLPGIDRLRAALREFSGPPEAILIGRLQRARKTGTALSLPPSAGSGTGEGCCETALTASTCPLRVSR